MNFCMNCGKELPDEARFCLMCGKNLNTNTRNETISLDIVKNRGGYIKELKFRAKKNTYCEIKKLLDASMENYLKSFNSNFIYSPTFISLLHYMQ